MANIFVDLRGSNTAPYDTKAKAAHSFPVAFGLYNKGDTIHVDDFKVMDAPEYVARSLPNPSVYRMMQD